MHGFLLFQQHCHDNVKFDPSTSQRVTRVLITVCISLMIKITEHDPTHEHDKLTQICFHSSSGTLFLYSNHITRWQLFMYWISNQDKNSWFFIIHYQLQNKANNTLEVTYPMIKSSISGEII